MLCSCQADSAAGALIRLAELDGHPLNVADTVSFVSCQRLVRRLCPVCSRPAALAPEELAQAKELASAGGLDWTSLPQALREARGCPNCGMPGFAGRTALAETMPINPEIARLVRKDAPGNEIQQCAIRQGMTTCAANGTRHLANGETTLAEVLRVCRPECSLGST